MYLIFFKHPHLASDYDKIANECYQVERAFDIYHGVKGTLSWVLCLLKFCFKKLSVSISIYWLVMDLQECFLVSQFMFVFVSSLKLRPNDVLLM